VRLLCFKQPQRNRKGKGDTQVDLKVIPILPDTFIGCGNIE
jgi:hypothetical protein